LLQLVDILLGAVMFFKKEEQGLVSEKNREKKLIVVEELHKQLGQRNMCESFSVGSSNSFKVWYG
jgi:hypothetical protein